MTEPAEFGPAMLALDERQRRFVVLFVENGGKNASACFRQAGYSQAPGATGGNSSRVLHMPRIQKALREYCESRNASQLPSYFAEMEALAHGKRGTPQQFAALSALMARAGSIEPKAAQVVEARVTHTLVDLRRRALELLADPILADVGQALLIEHQPEPEDAE